MSYKDFGNYAINFGSGLRVLGIEDHSNIGIFSINRPEWYVAHMGNLSQSYRSTALYDTLGPDAVAYIVKHSECPVESIIFYHSCMTSQFRTLYFICIIYTGYCYREKQIKDLIRIIKGC